MSAITVTQADFEQRVLKSDKPVLVTFGAPWCPFCRFLDPVFDEVAERLSDRGTFAKVNTDDNPGLKERYGIKGIPCTILFKDGQPVDRMIGAAPHDTVAAMVVPPNDAALAEVTEADFEQRVLRSAKPVLAHFGDPSMGGFRAMTLTLQKIAKEHAGRIDFVIVDTEKSPALSERYNIMYGRVIVFKDGEAIDRMDGDVPEEMILSMLQSIDVDRAVPEVKEADFEREVLQSDAPVLVDFWTPLLGSYRRAARVVAAQPAGRVRYFKLNVEQSPALGERYGVDGREPCLMLFKRGEVVDRMGGYIGARHSTEEALASMLTSWASEQNAKSASAIAETSETTFERDVLQAQTLVLVHFCAPWMGSYREQARIVEDSCRGQVRFVKVDTYQSPELKDRYGVDSIPCSLLFKDAKVIDQIYGYVGPRIAQELVSTLQAWIDESSEWKPSSVPEVLQANFDREVLQSETLVLVHFGASWMGSYRKPAHVVEEQYPGRVKLLAVNSDESPSLKEKYKVRYVPMLALFKGGEIVDRIHGYGGPDESKIDAVLSKHLNG